MTYKDAVNELVEMHLHAETMHSLFNDALRYNRPEIDELGNVYADALWAFCHRAHELWLELGGYEFCGDDWYLRHAAIAESNRRMDEFNNRPTVFHFCERGGNIDKWECTDLWKRDIARVWWHDNTAHENHESLIDELEAMYDVA